MSSTFEKSVKGATKLKLAPPKSKYVEHILQATRAGEAGVAEVFRVLTLRLRDSTWTIAFKALVVIHLMIREGEPNVTLRYLSSDPRKMVSLMNERPGDIESFLNASKRYADAGILMPPECPSSFLQGVSAIKPGVNGFQWLADTYTVPDEGCVEAFACDRAITLLHDNFAFFLWILTDFKPGIVQTQGRNIKHYSRYIIGRASAFQKVKIDYVLSGTNRLKSLSVDKGLLRETEIVQEQIQALVKCDLFADEMENEITLTAFRLLTMDLLVLYQVMNEGTICVLEHYFEMSRPDAERSLSIYKTFTKLTEAVVRFLAVARDHQNSTRLEIPKLRHAPTSLAASLEEYLNDRDFETNRQQYIAQQQLKKGIKSKSKLGTSTGTSAARAVEAKSTLPAAKPDTAPSTSQLPASQSSKGPAPDLIDFFDSIEQNQQPMAQSSAQFQRQAYTPQFVSFPQQTGQSGQMLHFGVAQPVGEQFASQPTAGGNPFMQFQQQPQQPQQSQYMIPTQAQPQFPGASVGGYTAQLQQRTPQQQFPQWTNVPLNNTGLDQFGQQPFIGQPFQQPQEQPTNPFRKSTMPTQMPTQTQGPINPSNQQHGSNPFMRSKTIAEENPTQHVVSPYAPQPYYRQTPPPQAQVAPSLTTLQPQQTGTNPFARNPSPSLNQAPQFPAALPGRIGSNPTGSSNPFKQNAFVNQQTGLGWQSGPQNSMGGLEALETVPVFPRPGQMSPQPFPQNQQQNQSPWL